MCTDGSHKLKCIAGYEGKPFFIYRMCVMKI